MRHKTRTLVYVATAEVPSGNVRVLTGPQPAPADAEGWEIHDASGNVVGSTWPTRSEALRQMGRLTMYGADLPLTLHRTDGAATGDRLG